jgi:hypothetical protein
LVSSIVIVVLVNEEETARRSSDSLAFQRIRGEILSAKHSGIMSLQSLLGSPISRQVKKHKLFL